MSGIPAYVSTTSVMTAQNVIMVPTDRSMPPIIMTSVMAMASTPLTEVACKIAIMFDVCIKLGDAMEKHD